MWDSLWGESSTKRAEETFNQLQNNVWKHFIHQSNRIVKFHNTHQSALTILDGALDRGVPDYFQLENMVNYSQELRRTPFASNLYDDLLHRVHSLRLHRENILQQQAQLSAQTDPDLLLTSFLSRQLNDVEKDLTRFEQELSEFGPSLNPPLGPTPAATSKTRSTLITADNGQLCNVQSSTPTHKASDAGHFPIDPAIPFPNSSSTTPDPIPGHHSMLTPSELLEHRHTDAEQKWTGSRIVAGTVRSLKCWVVRWFGGTAEHPCH